MTPLCGSNARQNEDVWSRGQRSFTGTSYVTPEDVDVFAVV